MWSRSRSTSTDRRDAAIPTVERGRRTVATVGAWLSSGGASQARRASSAQANPAPIAGASTLLRWSWGMYRPRRRSPSSWSTRPLQRSAAAPAVAPTAVGSERTVERRRSALSRVEWRAYARCVGGRRERPGRVRSNRFSWPLALLGGGLAAFFVQLKWDRPWESLAVGIGVALAYRIAA